MTDPIKVPLSTLDPGNLATDAQVYTLGQPDGDPGTFKYLLSLEIVEEPSSFTFSPATHGGKLVHSTSDSPITVTLPNSVTKPVICVIDQTGAGAVTFAAASGATVVNVNETYSTIGAGSVAFLQWISNADTSHAKWQVNGDLN